MASFSIDPQIKSAVSDYRDQAINIMSIQHKGSQVWAENFRMVDIEINA